MKMDFTFFYVESNIICIILFLMLLISAGFDRQEKQRIFSANLICYILYFTSDIFWALIGGGYIPCTRLTSSLVNISNGILLSAITCFWFVYVEISQGVTYMFSKKGRNIAKLPGFTGIAVMIFLFIFFPDLMLNEKYETTDLYSIVFISLPVIYIISATVRSLSRAFKKENYALRTQYLVCGVYPIIITIFGIIQTLWFSAPIFCFSCTIIMLYVYIVTLNSQVSLDDLTHLNNRTQLKKYVISESAKQSERSTHYILMIDLNWFKQINDQHGHVEGDIALRRTADALRTACSDKTLKTFIARYGGDEFIIIAKTDEEDKVKELCTKIKETIVRLNTEAGAEYDLTASIGYSCYNGDLMGFHSALTRADEALYKEKANRKAQLKR